MFKIFVAFCLIIPNFLIAQIAEDSATKNLNDVIVYTNKFPEKKKRIAQTSTVINNKSTLNFQANTGDALINSGAVFVQKSQQGGGSPVIRGFEASRVLLMVDGVRLNNAIYRAGHLQNIVTIDNMILDRIEVLYGPSSTIYGSDALGGVVNMVTKNPVLSSSSKTQITGNATLRYATAIEEARTNVQFNIGNKKLASFTSITYGSFGDMTQGKQRDSKYPNFGKQNFIVQRINNVDSAITNVNPNKQSPSGYNQVDITQKILYQPTSNIQHILNVQLSNSSDIPRYDRLSEITGLNPSFAEWYYGPQQRNMLAYHFNANNINGFFSEVKLVANYQAIEESRITRRFKNNNKDFRWERVDIVGVTLDAKHYNGKNEIHLGAEAYTNFVNSTAQRVNILSGIKSKIQTRYADGPTSMSSYSIYAQHTLKISENLALNDGLRFNIINLNARFEDTTILHLPFTQTTQNNLAFTGNIGLIYSNNKSRIALLINSGFRSPNVDDLSKVFETIIGRVIVPNVNIKPEFTYNAEVNFNHEMNKLSFGGSLFYTWFNNAIVVDKFTFNAADSILYNNVKSAVYAPQNKAKAVVYGFSVNAKYLFLPKTSIDAVYTITKGKYNNAVSEVPLDHIPPAYGRVGMKHVETKWQAEIFSLFNGWKRLGDYSPSGEDNLQYATIDGTPSWLTLNARIAANISKKLNAQLLVENIFDENYRYFASGISAAGRNIILSLKCNF